MQPKKVGVGAVVADEDVVDPCNPWVFEKVYRFTPFSDDARPEIRGKSPLQLAGYDLSRMPMPWLCRGYSQEWPVA